MYPLKRILAGKVNGTYTDAECSIMSVGSSHEQGWNKIHVHDPFLSV